MISAILKNLKRYGPYLHSVPGQTARRGPKTGAGRARTGGLGKPGAGHSRLTPQRPPNLAGGGAAIGMLEFFSVLTMGW